jgi:two-component system response regulator RpfG
VTKRRRGAAPTENELKELGFTFLVPEIEDVELCIVDDENVSLTMMEACLTRVGHPVRTFSNPAEALEAMRAKPPQILVTDVVMPGMSGVDLARQVRALDPDIGVVLVTGVGDAAAATAMLQLGVSSYLTKPVDRDELTRAVQRAFLRRAANEHHRAMVNWMYEAMDRNATAIREVTLGTLGSLMNALDARSPHFQGHSRAVAMQAAAVAQTLELTDNDVEEIRTAGLLHDIGMIGVPDAIVDKPGTLTEDETQMVRTHCEAGAAIVQPMKHLGSSIRYVLEHHERRDGSGYPDGKKGDEISLGGQIVGVAEAWTGILESRAYREGRPREEGMDILLSHRGEWFSEDVTAALIESDVGVIG